MPVLVTHVETGGEAQVITGSAVYKHGPSQRALGPAAPLRNYNSQRLREALLFAEQPTLNGVSFSEMNQSLHSALGGKQKSVK